MRVLIFGSLGQVGTALQQTCPPGTSIVAHDAPETDIRDRDAVERAMTDIRPELVINCAAFTRVDDAETETDEAFAANGVAPGIIAEVSARARVRFIHLSTDYVFDGRGHAPYQPDASVAPINAYGVTKLEGERRTLASHPSAVVVRTAWIHSGGGTNFVKTAVRLLASGRPMKVVDDQMGTPTRAAHLAEALWHIAARPDVRGLLHFTDAGVASWFDVASAVEDALRTVSRLGEGASVAPARSEEFPRPARRPQFSVLDKHSSWETIGYVPPHWRLGVIASTMELVNA